MLQEIEQDTSIVGSAMNRCSQHLSTGTFGLKAAARLAEIQTGVSRKLIEATYAESEDAGKKMPYELGWPISATDAAADPYFTLEVGLEASVDHYGTGIIILIDDNDDIHIAFEGVPRARTFGKKRVFLV
ncbi:MAG: hypothetical protein ABI162_09105 [Luteolibacter sp.]